MDSTTQNHVWTISRLAMTSLEAGREDSNQSGVTRGRFCDSEYAEFVERSTVIAKNIQEMSRLMGWVILGLLLARSSSRPLSTDSSIADCRRPAKMAAAYFENDKCKLPSG